MTEADASPSEPSDSDSGDTDSDSSVPAATSEDEDEDEEELTVCYYDKRSFPYPVGTKVAFPFTSGIFAGEIVQHFEDADTCLVRFTDGDEQELDRDETLHAIQLYKQKFD